MPKLCRFFFLGAVFALGAQAAEEYTWWVEPCGPKVAASTGCLGGDVDLGQWALEAWQRESGGAFSLRKSADEEHARLRIHWAGGNGSLFGEAQPILVEGKRGANIFVLPSTGSPGGDPLLRDAIVYLTCVHESGHALGLPHTAKFADIMYSFSFGGDLVEYFARYRRLLKARADIAGHAGISEADRVAIREQMGRQAPR